MTEHRDFSLTDEIAIKEAICDGSLSLKSIISVEGHLIREHDLSEGSAESIQRLRHQKAILTGTLPDDLYSGSTDGILEKALSVISEARMFVDTQN